jgi:hypothetical protein
VLQQTISDTNLGAGFLESPVRKNVMPVYSEIERFIEKGIMTKDGKENEYVVICATGFQIGFVPFSSSKIELVS